MKVHDFCKLYENNSVYRVYIRMLLCYYAYDVLVILPNLFCIQMQTQHWSFYLRRLIKAGNVARMQSQSILIWF